MDTDKLTKLVVDAAESAIKQHLKVMGFDKEAHEAAWGHYYRNGVAPIPFSVMLDPSQTLKALQKLQRSAQNELGEHDTVFLSLAHEKAAIIGEIFKSSPMREKLTKEFQEKFSGHWYNDYEAANNVIFNTLTKIGARAAELALEKELNKGRAM